MADEVRADTDALTRFTAGGGRFVRSLRGVEAQIGQRRSVVASALGDAVPADAVGPGLGELIGEATVNNGFVEVIRDALVAFDQEPGPIAVAAVATVDWALDDAELGVDGSDRSAAGDRLLAERADSYRVGKVLDALLDRPGSPVVDAGAALSAIVDLVDAGDDLHLSNGELNAVHDHLWGLSPDELEHVVANLGGEQLERIFHNAHSSGFWSNDWDDRERTEFYDTLDALPVEAKVRLGRYSPYLEAQAEALQATDGNLSAEIAVVGLTNADGFRTDLDFDERAALLWQVANYPDPVSIRNLERLTTKDWFVDFDLGDTQRSAKMVAFLSQYGTGDRVVLDNTLASFLAPDAPFEFDWSKDGTAYGSAGGDEAHLNRIYLPDGNDPVDMSVRRTAHMVTHTLAHEVNHLVNGDSVTESYEYFMAEYRAFYVGHTAQFGSGPTRGEVDGRVEYLLTATTGAYRRINSAVGDAEEGPKIATFVTDIVGREVTAENAVDELKNGVTDPTAPAPVPLSVDGGPNSLDNALQPEDP